MARFVDRRTFLRRSGWAAGLGILGAPLLGPSRASGAGERLVVAVGQWGIETPFAWRTSQSEKCLWDQVYDSLITRDPKTFLYRPGLATEWKPSNEMRTWTFKLRSGRAVSRGVGRDDGGGREVHRRAEPEARRPGRHGAVPAREPRPHRDAGQAHGGDAFQDPAVGRAVAVQPVRGLPEHHVEEVPRVRRRGEGIIASHRHRARTATSRASRATSTASRPCPTTGARRRTSRSS